MAKKKAVRKTRAAKKASTKASSKKAAATKTAAKRTATKKTVRKKPVRRKAATKKTVARKKTAVKKAAKKKAASRSVTQPAVRKSAARKARPMPLGRPRVTLDSKLEQLFLRDLEVREVCEFLRVTTLRELEEYRPEEIIEKLTAPVVQAVSRIRKALAMQNRCLKGDQKFAREFKQQVAEQMKRRR